MAESLDCAVVHGNYLETGGAEHVSHEIASLFDAPIYYGVGKDQDEISTEENTCKSIFNSSSLAPILKRSIAARDAFYFWSAQHIEELYEYDTLLFSKNELAWFVPKDDQTVIHYLHTTPRNPFDLFHKSGTDTFTRLYSSVARPLFVPTANYVDQFIANSELVARRAEKYYGVPIEDIEVVYPPVATEQYEPSPTKDYYLTFSRLDPAKQIDKIVAAFNDLDEKLVVGGTGEEEEKLKQMAGDNIEFAGYMSEEEKIRRLGEAKALVFNAMNEDFGMVPIEAFASQTPVLGINEGYTKYQIQSGGNGYLHEPNPASIRESVHTFEEHGVSWTGREFNEFASQFSTARFRERMTEVVADTLDRTAISGPDFPEDAVEFLPSPQY